MWIERRVRAIQRLYPRSCLQRVRRIRPRRRRRPRCRRRPRRHRHLSRRPRRSRCSGVPRQAARCRHRRPAPGRRRQGGRQRRPGHDCRRHHGRWDVGWCGGDRRAEGPQGLADRRVRDRQRQQGPPGGARSSSSRITARSSSTHRLRATSTGSMSTRTTQPCARRSRCGPGSAARPWRDQQGPGRVRSTVVDRGRPRHRSPPHSRSPARRYEYSNPTYKLVGVAAEQASGKKLGDALRALVLDPNAPRTESSSRARDASPRSHGRCPSRGTRSGIDVARFGTGGYLPCVGFSTLAWGASGVASDAPTLARWGWDLFAGDVISRSPPARDDDHGRRTSTGSGSTGSPIFVPDVAYGHAGSQAGYAALLAILPERHAVIVVFINDETATRHRHEPARSARWTRSGSQAQPRARRSRARCAIIARALPDDGFVAADRFDSGPSN